MDLNIRKTVIHNVKDNSPQELEATIVDSIERQDEHLLPGLGVLFELIWEKSSKEERDQLVSTLESGLVQ